MVTKQTVFKIDLSNGKIPLNDLKLLLGAVEDEVQDWQYVSIAMSDKFMMIGFDPENS